MSIFYLCTKRKERNFDQHSHFAFFTEGQPCGLQTFQLHEAIAFYLDSKPMSLFHYKQTNWPSFPRLPTSQDKVWRYLYSPAINSRVLWMICMSRSAVIGRNTIMHWGGCEPTSQWLPIQPYVGRCTATCGISWCFFVFFLFLSHPLLMQTASYRWNIVDCGAKYQWWNEKGRQKSVSKSNLFLPLFYRMYVEPRSKWKKKLATVKLKT